MRIVGKVRRGAKRARAVVRFGIPARVRVSSVAGFRIAHAAGAVLASRRHRWTIVLAPGTYRMAVECASGVDIEGPLDAVVVWDGPADTINLNAADVRVSGITVRHEGDDFFYALHCDALGPGSVILDRVAAYSDSKSALGIGICAGQTLEAYGCLFVRGERGRTSEPVLAHDMPDGSPGARVLLQDCYAYSRTGGPEAVWTSLAHGVPEPSPTLPSRWEPIAC